MINLGKNGNVSMATNTANILHLICLLIPVLQDHLIKCDRMLQMGMQCLKQP